ncbi:MAG: 50S ribosomal protein L9 [Bacilli bacterium]|nr:50S ribosomal protein L9 [Bacilli bacterium]
MKVILLSDVKKVGKKGSIVEVSDGYGANYLIPNKLAVKVTKTSMDIKNKQDDDKAKQDEQNRLDAIALKEKMENLTVELKAKVGKDGKMFGAISTKQIVEEYKKQFDIELDKRKIVDSKSISSLGYTKIKIELYKNVIATITIHIEEEK